MLEEIIAKADDFFSSSEALLIILGVFFLGMIFTTIIEKLVVKRVKGKRNKSNLGIFAHATKYSLVVLLVFYLFRSLAKPGTDYGIIIGFVSASLGFALQKPITSAAGWIIIVLKQPFYIGDRIILGEVKGDVLDITLTHIVLQEIGGTVSSEDRSGRIIHIPTIKLFEQNIVNYTFTDEFIRDEIAFLITYESNLEKSEFIIQKSANQVLETLNKENQKEPYVRLFFDVNGINIKVRYLVPASRRQEISSDIIRLIHEKFRAEPDITIAYPHLQLIRDTSPSKVRRKPKKRKKRH